MKTTILALTLLVTSSTFAAEYIVKLKDNNSMSKNQALNLFNTTSLEHHSLSLGEYYLIDVKDQRELQKIKRDSRVAYIEENIKIQIDPLESPTELITDPSYAQQWGLRNDGANGTTRSGAPGKEGVDIKAEDSWAIHQGDRRIKIAVIDTGVDYNHEDLKDNIWINEAEANGQVGIDDDGNGFIDDIHGYDFANNDGDPMDDNKHGTHCAGIIAGVHNDKGIKGVMSNAQIIPIKFLTRTGGGNLLDSVKAIDYAIKVGADIMSNSWGSKVSSWFGPAKPPQSLQDAVKRAEEKGIVFVAASGNSNLDTDETLFIPAGIELSNVISVGSHNGAGTKSSFSNFGKETVHVMAPGSNIYSTVLANEYKKLSGTSMATPFVSGIIGLLLSSEPHLTPSEVRERLITTSVYSDELNEKSISNGRVDAFRALRNITK